MNELDRYVQWLRHRLEVKPLVGDVNGYIAPTQISIWVPDARLGAGGGGFAPVPSLVSKLQQYMQGWVGTQSCRGFSKADITDLVQARADNSVADLGPFDSDTDPARVTVIVDQFVQVYAIAVKPLGSVPR